MVLKDRIGHVHFLFVILKHKGRTNELHRMRGTEPFLDRITGRTQQLSLAPQSGQTVPEYGVPEIRELIEGPYRIIYRTREEVVEVLAVVHGARLLPSIPPGSATE